MYMLRATEKQKHELVRAVKSKSKALQHFIVDPVLNIDETKQAESLWVDETTISLEYLSNNSKIADVH